MRFPRFILAALIAMLIGVLAMPANAVSPMANNSNLKNKIKAAGEDLDNANAKVAKAMKDYRQAAVNLPAAEAALSRAKSALRRAEAADSDAKVELQKVVRKSTVAETELGETQSELTDQQVEVGLLIRSMYRQGPMSELAVVLGADDPADFTQRLASVSSWTRNKEALIDSLLKTREDLDQQAKRLAALEEKKKARKAEAQARVLDAETAAKQAWKAQDKVNRIVAKKAAAMKEAMKYRDAVKKRYDYLKREQERLRKLAEDANEAGKDLVGKNDLLWPVTGARVTSYTGWRTHPVYGYRSCHTGIDLGAPSGTPIKASEDGVVATVGNGGPYGRYTLISHGEGLTTFYAHQLTQSVRDGERVKRGEVIGKVGSTGWSTGPHLHYEVRLNGTPYNPLGWFGSSKSRVSCVSG